MDRYILARVIAYLPMNSIVAFARANKHMCIQKVHIWEYSNRFPTALVKKLGRDCIDRVAPTYIGNLSRVQLIRVLANAVDANHARSSMFRWKYNGKYIPIQHTKLGRTLLICTTNGRSLQLNVRIQCSALINALVDF